MAAKKRQVQQYIIGVDLGGTNIVVGAMSADGEHSFATRSIPTSADLGAEGVADRIVGVIEGVILDTIAQTNAQRKDFLGVGIGAPGPLDREKGLVIVAPNLGWRNFPLRDRIGEKLNLPATLDNDANCATVGEWWQGSAQGGTNVIGITIGTGIGGGIILDGKLFHGSSDVAGEIGHTTIDLNGRHCKCGNYGCLEAYASGPAIAVRAREVLVREETASLLPSMVGGKLDEITAATVYSAASQGDAVASEIVRDTARYLGVGVANLLNTINADVVVIAGGVTAAGDALFVPLRAEVRRRAFRSAVDATRIVAGVLPGTAGVVGAVATFKMQHLGSL
ncbi:MAG TPA: ROK family protein [Gemmatimonadaceae bacterium]|jgi:glucokinase